MQHTHAPAHETASMTSKGEIRLVQEKRARSTKLRKSTFLMIVAVHAILLLGASFLIIQTVKEKPGDSLIFSASKPSLHSTTAKQQKNTVTQKKKNQSSSPPTAARVTTTANASITIPAVKSSLMTDFQPGQSMMTMSGSFGGGLPGGISTMSTGDALNALSSKVRFFDFEVSADNIVLAIDTSGSMIQACGGEKGIQKLRDSINQLITVLPAAAKFNIICFGQQADACFPEGVKATKANKTRAVEFMKDYYSGNWRTRTEGWLKSQTAPMALSQGGKLPEVTFAGSLFTPLLADQVKGLEGTDGGSRMDLALIAAMERQATAIYLVSDGQPGTAKNGKSLDHDDLMKMIGAFFKDYYPDKNKLIVHTLFTNTNRQEEDFMKKISRRYRGNHKVVKLD